MADEWEEGRRQLKISRVKLAKRKVARKMADSAKEILKTTNLGRTTIANARAVAGRTATIPVKNMNKSMALEKPPSTSSKIARVGRGLLRGLGIIGTGFLLKIYMILINKPLVKQYNTVKNEEEDMDNE